MLGLFDRLQVATPFFREDLKRLLIPGFFREQFPVARDLTRSQGRFLWPFLEAGLSVPDPFFFQQPVFVPGHPLAKPRNQPPNRFRGTGIVGGLKPNQEMTIRFKLSLGIGKINRSKVVTPQKDRPQCGETVKDSKTPQGDIASVEGLGMVAGRLALGSGAAKPQFQKKISLGVLDVAPPAPKLLVQSLHRQALVRGMLEKAVAPLLGATLLSGG